MTDVASYSDSLRHTGVSNDFRINEHVVAHAQTHHVIHLELVNVIVVKLKVSRCARNIAAP